MMKFMENYKKYCPCGSIFEKSMPIKHKESKKHQTWVLNNPNAPVALKYKCVCDSIIVESGLKTHLNTEKHKNFINATQKKENLINFDPEPQKKENLINFDPEPQKKESYNMKASFSEKLSEKASNIRKTIGVPLLKPTTSFKKEEELDRNTLKELESFLDNELRGSSSSYFCDCGSIIVKTGLKKHLMTKKHKDWLLK